MRKIHKNGLRLIVMLGLLTPMASVASYADMSCYDLWYARNKIFADAGECFKTRRSIETFGSRCYAPYGRISGYDDDRVHTIKYWERRKGCSGRYVAPSYDPGYRTGGGYAHVSGIRWNDTLAVRTGPSRQYRRIGDLPPNATGVRILNCTRSWCRIEWRGIVGWSYAKYLRSN